MEDRFSLGYIVDKSSDPKRSRILAIFFAAMGSVVLLIAIPAFFSNPGWNPGLFLMGISIFWLVMASLTGLCRTEIEFDRAGGQIVRRRFVLGKAWSISTLPLDRLRGIRAVEMPTGDADASSGFAGRLEFLRADETTFWGAHEVWTDWRFPTVALAEEVRDEILAWLEERSDSLPQRYPAETYRPAPPGEQEKPPIRRRLGTCLIAKTPATLWRRIGAIFFASIAAVGSSHIDRGMLIRAGIWVLVFLILAFFIRAYRREIQIDLPRGRVMHRFSFMGWTLSVSILPLNRLKAVRLAGKGSVSVLEWVRVEGNIWQRWDCLDGTVALQACREIVDWLQAHSVSVAREDAAGFHE